MTSFDRPARPNPDAVARAITRTCDWTLVVTGNRSHILTGLSMQVPGRWEHFSDGLTKRYEWDGGRIHPEKWDNGTVAQDAARSRAHIAPGARRLSNQTRYSVLQRKSCILFC